MTKKWGYLLLLLTILNSAFAHINDDDCPTDDTDNPSYVAMKEFTTITGPLQMVILTALNTSYGAWKSCCELTLRDGNKIKDDYIRDLKCTADKEITDHSFMEIDEYIAILKFWCNSMTEVQKDSFFDWNTIQCLKDTKKKFDNCIGYFSRKPKVQNRDYCKSRDSYTVTECVRKAVKKCDDEGGNKLRQSVEDLVEYSKSVSLCGYDSLLWNFHIVRTAVQFL